MDEIAILGAARTPIGRFLGALATVPAPALGAVAIRAALAQAGVEPAAVDEVILGHVLGAGAGMSPARQAAIAAGIPPGASALSVNKVCASGLTAVVLGAQAIALGEAGVVVAGGMESMSLAPHLLRGSRTGVRLGGAELVDSAVHDGLWCAWEGRHMGSAAEEIARKHGIGREAQDAYALASHRRAVAAAGAFRAELAPVEVRQKGRATLVEADEGPRRDTSAEALARLAPAFEPHGTVTAGNAPGLSDGAAALVLSSGRLARERGWPVLAWLRGAASASLEPRWLFEAPVAAVRRLGERSGLALDDFDLIEVNEAFAAQVLANGQTLGWDWSRVNVRGGAIALGHPLGCSGARILVTLLHALTALPAGGQEESSRGSSRPRRGLAALCHGGGGAVAVAVELAGEASG